MLTLNDGRAELWQWDTGRTLAVDADCSQVHFSNKVFGRSIDVDVVDGVATIPDILLQTDKDLNVWAFVGTAENGYTKISKTFKVNRRNKPADYVFTPPDQMTLQTIQSQIGDLADLTTEAKDTLVAAINEAAKSGGGGSVQSDWNQNDDTQPDYIKNKPLIVISFKPAGKSYLTFSSPNSFTLKVNDATKHWDGTLEYFAPDKIWTVWDGTTTLSAVDDDGEYVLYLRGTGNTNIGYYNYDTEDYIPWVINGTDVRCNGNIETLLDYATVEAGQHPTMAYECFIGLFKGCIALSQAPDLSATTLADYCYDSMFRDCTSLTQAPALPATTLMVSCYNYMFRDCTSLTQAPALPATTLANNCYSNMFHGCTSLTQAPELPATTLSNSCYSGMFSGCTGLTKAPALPATTLARMCYGHMFEGCTSLKLSSTRTGEYTQEYRIPSSGDGVAATDALADMFTSTGGTFKGTPTLNTAYYLSSDNMIVRETEIDTLNGYVGSMIDVAIAEHTSNPLNITGATVGQIAKITAVDSSGKPTAWEAADMEASVDIDISRAPDLIIEVAEAVTTLSISEINGVPINTTEMVVLWEHPGGAQYVPNYFRFNNSVIKGVETTATLANWNFNVQLCPSVNNAAAILSRVKKVNDGVYYYEFSGLQQNAGTIAGVFNPVYGAPYSNILDGETSIKEFFVYQTTKIQPGCKVSVWVK